MTPLRILIVRGGICDCAAALALMRAVHHGRGRITSLGYACHSVLPYRSHGNTEAIEDGATLACYLVVKADKLTSAMFYYEALHKARTSDIQAAPPATGDFFTCCTGRQLKPDAMIAARVARHLAVPDASISRASVFACGSEAVETGKSARAGIVPMLNKHLE